MKNWNSIVCSSQFRWANYDKKYEFKTQLEYEIEYTIFHPSYIIILATTFVKLNDL